MDRNSVIGFFLMLALLLVYFLVFDPGEQMPAEGQSQTIDSTLKISDEPAIAPDSASGTAALTAITDSAAKARLQIEQLNRFGAFYPAAEGETKKLTLSNNKVSIDISTKGGLPVEAVLAQNFITYWDSVPVRLWDGAVSSMALELKTRDGKPISSSDLHFSVRRYEAQASGDKPALLELELPTTEGNISVTYILTPDNYELSMTIDQANLSKVADTGASASRFVWKASALHQEKGIANERQHSSVFFREFEEKRDYLSESTEDETTTEGRLNWVAFKQNFFNAAIISDQGFESGASLKSYPPALEGDTLHTMHYEAVLPIDFSASAAGNFRFYFGPNEFKSLKALEVEEFGRIIDYGWGIFGWVNRNIVRPLFIFLSELIPNYGIVILIVTILIKLLLFPVTWKNYLSSAKMRVLKPEMDELNKKYEGKDALEKQQAIMGLYRETGVNPMAGCIPVLLQMPILYAMFRFFPASIELRQKGFLWAEDLGGYDSILNLPFNIPLYGSHVSGFTLLMAASTFIYTRMSTAQMPTTTQPGMPNMKLIMNIFPFMMLFFFNSFPSGLSFYYFAANVISIGQMWFIKEYIIDESKIREKIEANKKKPKKKSAFAQRLEEMQKQQQEKLRNQKNSRK
jgi:YidC/Oxa1 family membrane protein insertase